MTSASTGPPHPTMDAVAARAGVGRGTVSRVVNGSPQVSERARTAVRQAIEELGYVPNRAARSLVTRRTDSIALVVSKRGQPGRVVRAGCVREREEYAEVLGCRVERGAR